MMKHKKAIMLDFVATVILALIIFVPTILIISKFLHQSNQAKDSFNDFTTLINKMSESNSATKESFLLILDSASAVVYFEPNQKEVSVEVDAEFLSSTDLEESTINTDYTLKLQKPGTCSSEKNCLCLFREPKFKILTSAFKQGFGFDEFKVVDASPLCREINVPLKLANCGVGQPHNVNSYTCTHGFMIERHLAAESKIEVASLTGTKEVKFASYYEAYRRTALTMNREGNTIVLNTQS